MISCTHKSPQFSQIGEDPSPAQSSRTALKTFISEALPRPCSIASPLAAETFQEATLPQQMGIPQQQQLLQFKQQAKHTPLPSQPQPIPLSNPTPRGGGGVRHQAPLPSPAARKGSEPKPSDVIYEMLTADNYKSKFQELLKCEESTQISILENR